MGESVLPFQSFITCFMKHRHLPLKTKTHPLLNLLKKAAGIKSGSGRPNTEKVGKVTRAQLRRNCLKRKDADLYSSKRLDELVKLLIFCWLCTSMGLVYKDKTMAKLSKRMRLIRSQSDVT